MLRRARWFILLAILAIALSVGAIYRARRQALLQSRPRPSAPLPSNTSATANQWEYEIKSGDNAKLLIRARHFQQIKNPPVFEFRDLEMEIRKLDGSRYDLVKSAHATFDQQAGSMFSDGDVEITMGLHQDPSLPAGRLMKIRTSGVTLDVKSSRATTDRPAEFEFDRGSGQSLGATYDPSTKEVIMHAEAKIDWRGADPKKPTMHIESSHLVYREADAQVLLSAPSSLTRGAFRLDAADSIVFLNSEGQFDRVEAAHAQGADRQPKRSVEYAADHLNLFLTPKGEVKKIEALNQARLNSTSASGLTRISANRFDLDFEPGPETSELRHALATGAARVESQPAINPPKPPQGRRILTSETIELNMRPGGEEIDKVSTHAPGQVDFLPAKPGDPRRTVNGDRLSFEYGPENVIRSCRATGVTTTTERPPDPKQKDAKPRISHTRSQDMLAQFDPKTGQLTQLEQWNNFEYEEGARRASADHANFEAATEIIRLRDRARMWDATGSTSANEIVLQQQTGVMVATGNVSSMRQPEKKKSSEGLMSDSEPLNARAEKMTTSEGNTRILYEGKAMLWQGPSRLQARSISIDRAEDRLVATGDVVSELPEKSTGTATSANRFTIVRAPSLVYSDKEKLATYSGGAVMDRGGLNVKARQLRAWFADQPAPGGATETKLDKMFCDGDVHIFDKDPKRTRTGSSEHAEYYLADERMILSGGNPMVADSARGLSRGALITWFAREDKLVVDNSGAGPAVSRINQSRKK